MFLWRQSATVRNSLKVCAALLPIVTVAFVVAEHQGWWDRFLGLNHVLVVASRFETSYAPNVLREVVPGDDAWEPLLDLIQRYSSANLPQGRQPRKIARHKAILSEKIDFGPVGIAEWTAPTTPVVLLYKDWPGSTIDPADYRFVGGIGDLRLWVERRRADFNFLTKDILIGLTGAVVSLWVWLAEAPPGTARSGETPGRRRQQRPGRRN